MIWPFNRNWPTEYEKNTVFSSLEKNNRPANRWLNLEIAVRGQSPSPLTGMFFLGLYHHVCLGVLFVCLQNYLNNVLDII
jgi:hypothetical protein